MRNNGASPLVDFLREVLGMAGLRNERDTSETWKIEVAVEREGPMDSPSFHKREGDAVREADILIVVLLEKDQGVVFFRFIGTKNIDQLGFVDASDLLSCKAVAGATPQKGCELIEDEVARTEPFLVVLDPTPDRFRLNVVLIVREILAEKRSRIHEDQSSSP
jgi:hypothetical protein